MESSPYEKELALNKRAFEEQRQIIRRDYPGLFVAFAFGRVVAAGPKLDDVIAKFDDLDPPSEAGCVFRAEDEPAFEAVESVSSEFLPE